jgi:hypothetical protein
VTVCSCPPARSDRCSMSEGYDPFTREITALISEMSHPDMTGE